MDEMLSDSQIHEGHRGRMRAKLRAYGQNIFDTYELLEMLLYYTIPYKDTNPIAKRLLAAFGSLDGVLSASVEELTAVSGVGQRSAVYLKRVDALCNLIGAEPECKDTRFIDNVTAGRYLVSRFKNEPRKRVLALYLDSNMSLLDEEFVFNEVDFDSAAVTASPIISRALKLGAAAVITAHNHPLSSSYPTQGDRATDSKLTGELAWARITHAGHFVVSGNRYTFFSQNPIINFCQSTVLDDFIRSHSLLNDSIVSESDAECLSDGYNSRDLAFLEELCSYCSAKAGSADIIGALRRYRTVENLLAADASTLAEMEGDGLALYLKLLGYIASRRHTDLFAFGRVHSDTEVVNYFKALFIGVSVENIYIMCFDGRGRAILCERVSEGVVNSAEVLPRKLIEVVVRCSAKKAVIAHNHPFGNPSPSGEDVEMTAKLRDLFRAVGVELVDHLIIAGQQYRAVRVSGE